MGKVFCILLSAALCIGPSVAFSQGPETPYVRSEVKPPIPLDPRYLPTGPASKPTSALIAPAPIPSAIVSEVLDRYELSLKITNSIISLSDPNTKIAPSHFGHPGYEDAAFLYDKAVDALVLKAAGRDKEARSIMDYFSRRIRIPAAEVRRNADANGIYGILKLFPSVDNPRSVSLVNAFSTRSTETQGEGKLEYWTTPGPLAFMILAFLSVDRKGYLYEAEKLGECLLTMQASDGGITDGDRNAVNIHTEPHMDSFSALLMLYEVTGDKKWSAAAEKAWRWFTEHVYLPGQDTILQGVRGERPSEVFATDAYSWTIAGRAGERIPLDAQERLIERMLKTSLSKVKLELPDGKLRTLTLVDFADGKDIRVAADRGGVHPMGSVEWIGGVILCLQKTAVRFWEEGDSAGREKARYYKALAEYFMAQSLDSYYALDGVKGLISFYATGQWMATGHGWRTPYFYVKNNQGKAVLKGGSTIAAWPVLPLKRSNPFKLDDTYGAIYDVISVDEPTREQAEGHVASLVLERTFEESVPHEIAEGADEIPELWRYNQNMYKAISSGDYYSAMLWAEKVVSNADWLKIAKEQQKRKAEEFGGLIDYPWGTPLTKAADLKRAVTRFPLLNEMGAAMWGMTVAQFQMGNRESAKAWIRTMLEAIPYHQIFAPEGPGYWNALVSWETNPAGTQLDSEIGELYREILVEKGQHSALPPLVKP